MPMKLVLVSLCFLNLVLLASNWNLSSLVENKRRAEIDTVLSSIKEEENRFLALRLRLETKIVEMRDLLSKLEAWRPPSSPPSPSPEQGTDPMEKAKEDIIQKAGADLLGEWPDPRALELLSQEDLK